MNIDSSMIALLSLGMHSTERISRYLFSLKINHRIVLLSEVPDFKFTHIILSGSNKRVCYENYYHIPEWVMQSDKPVLGIGYGFELIVQTLGGEVRPLMNKDKGVREIFQSYKGNKSQSYNWFHRYDHIVNLPDIADKFVVTAINCDNHIIAANNSRWFGVQYYPEMPKFRNPLLFLHFAEYTVPTVNK